MALDLDVIREAVGEKGERRWFDIERMRSRAAEHWDPGIVYEEAPDWPGAITVTGPESIIDRIQEYSEVIGEAELEIEEVAPVDEERALVVIRAHGHSVAGVPIDRRWANVLTVSDSKLVRWSVDPDPERVRRQLGTG